MALYAFDGTWNRDEESPKDDSNVVRFRDIYALTGKVEYCSGVGTRFGRVGRVLGGVFGVGGRSRIEELYDAARANWENGDHEVDVIGFSRGAAMAVHFANVLGEQGLTLSDGTRVMPEIRFLGLWDIVGSFGLNFDFAGLTDFQNINLGWTIDRIPLNVQYCCHAMAINERRKTFHVTRPVVNSSSTVFKERWFKGVHSDIGGGNQNVSRSDIALHWMLEMACDAGLALDEDKVSQVGSAADRLAPIGNVQDLKRDDARKIREDDQFHPTALPVELSRVGDSAEFVVHAANQYNWSAVLMKVGQTYQFDIDEGENWQDAAIVCGAKGWVTDDLPYLRRMIVRRFENQKRYPEANWLELVGSEDDDESYFRIGAGGPGRQYTVSQDAELYAFANDLKTKYDNNKGSIRVKVTRVGPGK